VSTTAKQIDEKISGKESRRFGNIFKLHSTYLNQRKCANNFERNKAKLKISVSWEGSSEWILSFSGIGCTLTHYIGKVFSAYIVDGATNSSWTLIGKSNPSLPQVLIFIFKRAYFKGNGRLHETYKSLS
jgi:hypothetical protein